MSISMRRILCSVVLAAALGAPAAQAAPTWFPLPAFPNATDPFSPRVIVSAKNDVTATWIAKDGPGSHAIEIATVPRGPGVATTTSFSRGTASLGTEALAGAPTGDAIVAFSEGTGFGYSLRQAPGGFQAPATRTAADTQNKDFVTSAVSVSTDSQGQFLVAYGDEVPPPFSGSMDYLDRVLVWTIDGATGLVSGPVAVAPTLSASGMQISHLALAEAPDGSAVLAFQQHVGLESYVLATSRAGDTDTFPPASVLDFHADEPRAAIDRSQRMLVAFRSTPAPGAPEIRAWESQPGGGGRFAPVGPFATGTLSDANLPAGEPNIAFDAAGRATVVWETCADCSGSPSYQVFAQRLQPNGALDGVTQPLSSTSTDIADPQLALTPAGGAVALWRQSAGGHAVLEYARRSSAVAQFAAAAQVPGAPEVSTPGGDEGPYVGLDAQGDAAAVWEQSGAVGTNLPLLARLDAAPPSTGPITVNGGPPSLFAPLDFSIAPDDAVSPTTVRWDFGDGTGRPSGDAVRHSFDHHGQFTVTATVTDAAGNVATARTLIGLGSARHGTAPRFVGPTTVSPTGFAPQTRRHPHGGTSFHWRLNVPARVGITLTRLRDGRRVKGRCVRPTGSARHAPRCDRTQAVGSLSKTAAAGSSTLGFSGLVAGQPLPPGRYRATLVASGRGGRSAPVTVTFEVL